MNYVYSITTTLDIATPDHGLDISVLLKFQRFYRLGVFRHLQVPLHFWFKLLGWGEVEERDYGDCQYLWYMQCVWSLCRGHHLIGGSDGDFDTTDALAKTAAPSESSAVIPRLFEPPIDDWSLLLPASFERILSDAGYDSTATRQTRSFTTFPVPLDLKCSQTGNSCYL